MDSRGTIYTDEEVKAMSAEERARHELVEIPYGELSAVAALNLDARARWYQARRVANSSAEARRKARNKKKAGRA